MRARLKIWLGVAIGATLLTSGVRTASNPASGDWPMWGGSPERNMVSLMKGLPTTWDVKTGKNVKWVAKLGLANLRQPGRRRRRRAGRHQQRAGPRSQAAR